MGSEKTYSIADAARQLKVSRQTLYTWIQQGEIKPVTSRKGRQRINQTTLDDLLKTIPPAEQREAGNSLLYDIVRVVKVKKVRRS